MNSSKWRPFAISILISVGVGTLSAFFTMNSMEIYKELEKPPLSPPGFLFPIVWTILYVLMGIAAYLIYRSNSPDRGKALLLYGVQLLVNGLWPVLFFDRQMYLLAFLWLLLLWGLILLTILRFCAINKCAAYLLLPYLIWVTFAGYLNLGVYLLNR